MGKDVQMRTYKDYITGLRSKYIGRKVEYEGKAWMIVDVDYNGIIHINRPTTYNDTTAAYEPYEADKHMIG